MFITPIFRSDISCFGQSSCYPLAFGVPALLMIVALILFLVGTPFYVRSPPAKGNVVVQFVSCVIVSLMNLNICKLTNLFKFDFLHLVLDLQKDYQHIFFKPKTSPFFRLFIR